MPVTTPIPAATLILLRDRADGPPHILMVERARQMAFAGGALVFPGGRIDPGDHVLAIAGGDPDDAPRIAAIRETIEEVGVAVGLSPAPGADAVAAMRAALADEQAWLPPGTALDPAALVAFTRWCPDLPHARIFDTHFYLAAWPEGHAPPIVDGTENARVFWTTAAEALADADGGRARVIFPTRRVLERLALFGSFADAVADAHAHRIRTVTPWIETRADGDHLCIPGDLGYPVTSERANTAFRG